MWGFSAQWGRSLRKIYLFDLKSFPRKRQARSGNLLKGSKYHQTIQINLQVPSFIMIAKSAPIFNILMFLQAISIASSWSLRKLKTYWLFIAIKVSVDILWFRSWPYFFKCVEFGQIFRKKKERVFRKRSLLILMISKTFIILLSSIIPIQQKMI